VNPGYVADFDLNEEESSINPILLSSSFQKVRNFNSTTSLLVWSDLSELLNCLQVIYRETKDGDGRDATPSTRTMR
jgi:hypothetical protein